MPYIRFAPQADNRRAKQATPPISMQNVYLESTPAGTSKRSEFFVTSRPGRTRREALPGVVRGLFCEPGCRDGNLFAPAGGALYEVFPGFSYSNVGALAGGSAVKIVPYRDDIALNAFGQLFVYDGLSLTQITDVDAPSNAGGLASVGLRLVSFEVGAVAYYWSKAGLPLDWPSDGEAATPDLSDPIVSVEEVNDDLWVFGKRKIRPWQATGSAADADAFALIPGGGMKRGLAAAFASADIGGPRMFIGDNRAVFVTSGVGAEPIPYRPLELVLADLTTAQMDNVKCWSFETGSRRFWGCSTGVGDAFVRDITTGLWSTWSRYGEEVFDIDFTANAFGRRVAASVRSTYLWTLDDDVFTDDGDPLIRVFTFQIASGGETPVDHLVFDIETHGVPLEGDGASPVMTLEYSTDNGANWIDYGDVELPHANDRIRPAAWGLGLADGQAGMLVRLSVSGPFGFSAYGMWVNPEIDEITMA